MDLPPEFAAALDGLLAGRPQRDLTEASGALSHRYRRPRGRQALVGGAEDALAYAVYRLPATFAAIRAVLTEVATRRPGWQPRSILDVGAGPGTASWAALSVWPDIEQITCLERNPAMRALGQQLAEKSSYSALLRAEWRAIDVSHPPDLSAHDLVVAGYVLGEVPPERLPDIAGRLWAMTREVLAVVEPGTPAGYRIVLDVRAQFLEQGAWMVAPCPHADACPLAGVDWCHFAARLSRSRLHRQVKRGTLSYEDEKFSYVALSRTPVDMAVARIIRHPQTRRGHISLELCTPAGIRHEVVTRGDRERYRAARDAGWGDDFSA